MILCSGGRRKGRGRRRERERERRGGGRGTRGGSGGGEVVDVVVGGVGEWGVGSGEVDVVGIIIVEVIVVGVGGDIGGGEIGSWSGFGSWSSSGVVGGRVSDVGLRSDNGRGDVGVDERLDMKFSDKSPQQPHHKRIIFVKKIQSPNIRNREPLSFKSLQNSRQIGQTFHLILGLSVDPFQLFARQRGKQSSQHNPITQTSDNIIYGIMVTFLESEINPSLEGSSLSKVSICFMRELL